MWGRRQRLPGPGISLRLRHGQSLSLGLWCRDGDVWCRVAEYYHSGRATGVQLTDEEYYAHLCELAGDRPIAALIIDPSAASFAETVLRHGRYPVLKADNDVVAGIHRVSRALQQAQIKIAPGCKDALREFSCTSGTTVCAGTHRKRKRPCNGRHSLLCFYRIER